LVALLAGLVPVTAVLPAAILAAAVRATAILSTALTTAPPTTLAPSPAPPSVALGAVTTVLPLAVPVLLFTRLVGLSRLTTRRRHLHPVARRGAARLDWWRRGIGHLGCGRIHRVSGVAVRIGFGEGIGCVLISRARAPTAGRTTAFVHWYRKGTTRVVAEARTAFQRCVASALTYPTRTRRFCRDHVAHIGAAGERLGAKPSGWAKASPDRTVD